MYNFVYDYRADPLAAREVIHKFVWSDIVYWLETEAIGLLPSVFITLPYLVAQQVRSKSKT